MNKPIKITLPPTSSCLIISDSTEIEVYIPKQDEDEEVNPSAMLMAMCLVLLSDTPFGVRLRTMCQKHMMKH